MVIPQPEAQVLMMAQEVGHHYFRNLQMRLVSDVLMM
jgi:hypothetical protein